MRLFIFLLVPLLLHAGEMRDVYLKAKEEYVRSRKELIELRKSIGAERKKLKGMVKEKRKRVAELKKEVERKRKELDALYKKEEELLKKRRSLSFEMDELVGSIRIFAKRVRGVFVRSPFTAVYPQRISVLDGLLKKESFPSMDRIKKLFDQCFRDMELSGEVGFFNATYVGSDGKEKKGEVLYVGPFTLYGAGKGSFLMYDPDERKLVSLEDKTPWRFRRVIKGYAEGKREDVYVDISGGAALNQLLNRLTFSDQVRKGGPIGVVILLLGIFSLLLIAYKFIHLGKLSSHVEGVFPKVEELVGLGKFEELRKYVEGIDGPLSRVVKVGLQDGIRSKDVAEGLLEEAVLKEVPRVERFLSTLQIIASIAPLLGLLGTVTGMISTFHSITLFGTGNPRMMSGGISEALITTEFGLMVAIPTMFFYALLSRKADAVISKLEEAANLILGMRWK